MAEGTTEGMRLLWSELSKRNLRQSDLCRLLELESGTLNRWLHGERRPSRSWATKLRDKLGIDPASWELPPKRAFHIPTAA